jgi:hypothetical protein
MSWGRNILGKFVYYELSNLCSGRVYPVMAPQNPILPHISYTVVSTVPNATKDSRSTRDKVRLQISIFDKTKDSVNTIASQVRDQLDMTYGFIAGIQIDQCRFDDDIDLYDKDLRIHYTVQDYLVGISNGIDSGPGPLIQTEAGKTDDFTSTYQVPPGYTLAYVLFENTVNKPAQLSCGSTAGGNDVFSSEPIKENGMSTIRTAFTATDFTSLYFNHTQEGDTWNGITANIYIVLLKIK